MRAENPQHKAATQYLLNKSMSRWSMPLGISGWGLRGRNGQKENCNLTLFRCSEAPQTSLESWGAGDQSDTEHIPFHGGRVDFGGREAGQHQPCPLVVVRRMKNIRKSHCSLHSKNPSVIPRQNRTHCCQRSFQTLSSFLSISRRQQRSRIAPLQPLKT